VSRRAVSMPLSRKNCVVFCRTSFTNILGLGPLLFELLGLKVGDTRIYDIFERSTHDGVKLMNR
jgi:hypothetical protein